jgi:hypothetical protein
MAARLPTVIVATATIASSGSQVVRAAASGPRKMRSRKAMAGVLLKTQECGCRAFDLGIVMEAAVLGECPILTLDADGNRYAIEPDHI